MRSKSTLRQKLALGTYALACAGAFLFALAYAQVATSQTTPMMQPPGMKHIAQKAWGAPTLPSFVPAQTPATIPQSLTDFDLTGQITTFQPNGPTTTAGNGFFSTVITNNSRSCFTCHRPGNDWEISPPQILTELFTTNGTSALFQPIDSAVCPNSPLLSAKYPSPKFISARAQLFTRGNFRIAINAPNPLGSKTDGTYTTFDGNVNPEWVLTVTSDPYGCETDQTYGLPSNQLSVYRRPLNSDNVAFLVQNPGFYQNTGPANVIPPEERQDIMWDAREPDLRSQFIDATEFHGQTTTPPDLTSIEQGVLFQSGLFTAQTYDYLAGDLTGSDSSGALGGPVNLYDSLASRAIFDPVIQGGSDACIDYIATLTSPYPFVPGVLPLGAFGQLVCPGEPAIGAVNLPKFVTQLFTAFANPTTGSKTQKAKRESIARGEAIFTGQAVTFTINDVPGFTEIAAGGKPAPGSSCQSCHNNTNAVNDAFGDPKRLGIMDNSNKTNDGGIVNVMAITRDFPQFAFYCPTGSILYFSNPVKSMNCPGSTPGHPATCDEFITTDPGKGLVTGKCADLGKMKVPILRGVAARAPYFHGGNAFTLDDVVNFYNNRFNIGLTAQQKTDLVNYLSSL